jgi:hypothetical protein
VSVCPEDFPRIQVFLHKHAQMMLSKDGCKVEGWNVKEVFDEHISAYFVQVRMVY